MTTLIIVMIWKCYIDCWELGIKNVNWNNRFGSNLLFGCAKRENVKNNIDHDCVLMADKEHRDHYWMAVAHYNKLIEEGENK